MAKKDPFQELMSNIDWTQWMQVIIPVMQPIIIFGAWLGLSKIDSRADLVSKIIAIAEPIPTLDLNVPRPVVLASIYHSVDETLDMLSALMDVLQDIPGIASEKIEKLKDDVLPEIVKETKPFLDALSDCRDNAKKNLGFTYPVAGPFWILSCMQQKGFKITIEYIKDKFF